MSHTKEHVTLEQYRRMVAVRDDAKTAANARIRVLLRSILLEIEISGAPYASTIEAAREAMDADDTVEVMSLHLAMGCEIVPDDQIEMSLESAA